MPYLHVMSFPNYAKNWKGMIYFIEYIQNMQNIMTRQLDMQLCK